MRSHDQRCAKGRMKDTQYRHLLVPARSVCVPLPQWQMSQRQVPRDPQTTTMLYPHSLDCYTQSASNLPVDSKRQPPGEWPFKLKTGWERTGRAPKSREEITTRAQDVGGGGKDLSHKPARELIIIPLVQTDISQQERNQSIPRHGCERQWLALNSTKGQNTPGNSYQTNDEGRGSKDSEIIIKVTNNTLHGKPHLRTWTHKKCCNTTTRVSFNRAEILLSTHTLNEQKTKQK